MSLVTMREILPYAEEKKIAIPAFNIDTMEITQAILETVRRRSVQLSSQSVRQPSRTASWRAWPPQFARWPRI